MVDHTQFVPQPPKQVRDQVAAAEAMYQQVDENGQPIEPVQTEPEQEQQDDQAGEFVPESEQQPGEDDETWERRHKSLQGRYDTMTRNYQDMQRQLAMLRAGGVAPQTPEPAKAQPKKLITEAEETEYGSEFFQVVGKKAREEVEPVFNDLSERMKRLEGRVEGVGSVIKQSQQMGMYEQLAHNVPNWKEVNRSPEFKEWLAQPDPYSGRVKHEMLKEAFTGQDTNRVVNFFQGFLTEATGLPSNASSPGAVTTPLPGNGQGNGQPSLEDFAAPGRARSAPAGHLPSDKPTYTHADIAKFMADKRTGKWKGREADADMIERDIFQAQHEGRIFNS